MATYNENHATSTSLKDHLELFWLDSHICEEGQHDDIKFDCRNISPLISKRNFIDSGDGFTNYTNNNPNSKLITIMSGRFARQLLALVSPQENLHSVYVFTINIEKLRVALGDEPKLKGIFNAENALFDELRKDLSILFWDEAKRLVALNRDQEATVYFAESYRLQKLIQ